ncbi:hypothetical protein EDF62_1563 [Leucobacter luti]|uniref:Uncharacterized protein n=1 Tax=Leucobacter luti TaxID=340320 RepID=A0A4R6S091_9MICO|nr:hypothetical protein [Leucobacter luti]TDP92357.1 hypothetical protein EDF62_1563 [Leucobacter luti]
MSLRKESRSFTAGAGCIGRGNLANGQVVTVIKHDGEKYRGYMLGYARDPNATYTRPLAGPPRIVPLAEPQLTDKSDLEYASSSMTIPTKFLLSDADQIVTSQTNSSAESLEQFIGTHRRKARKPRAHRPTKAALHKSGTLTPGAAVRVRGLSGTWLIISDAPPSDRRARQVHVQHARSGALETVQANRCTYLGPAVN